MHKHLFVQHGEISLCYMERNSPCRMERFSPFWESILRMENTWFEGSCSRYRKNLTSNFGNIKLEVEQNQNKIYMFLQPSNESTENLKVKFSKFSSPFTFMGHPMTELIWKRSSLFNLAMIKVHKIHISCSGRQYKKQSH